MWQEIILIPPIISQLTYSNCYRRSQLRWHCDLNREAIVCGAQPYTRIELSERQSQNIGFSKSVESLVLKAHNADLRNDHQAGCIIVPVITGDDRSRRL